MLLWKGKNTMALLTLKGIGKIYASDGNIAVGIRGVDLSFDVGEFVVVTGRSGSGKSTLLNVISGMDTYEEGEMLVEGEPTSHYLQPEWERYRERYISFIFQDYNIIESFTVLQNVELALMHIDDAKERRAKALALIDRVGLTSHKGQKGSRLSGGQKQRTVIARALAKDSPVILADEPTGNLDSATSAEIVSLLQEVARDKLVIVVTHNFEQFAATATRHIRIFDGAVESDTPYVAKVREEKQTESVAKVAPAATKKRPRLATLRKGARLGISIFASKPRLSLFLCMLLIIGTLGIFSVTPLTGDAAEMFAPRYMFTPIKGRVVLTTQDGTVPTAGELETLAATHGATGLLRYDLLLDTDNSTYCTYHNSEGVRRSLHFDCVYGEEFGNKVLGRYPTATGEVFLYLPISEQPDFGKDAIAIDTVSFHSLPLSVVGVGYYYDNNLTPKLLFTEEGFRVATAAYYLLTRSELNMEITVQGSDGSARAFDLGQLTPSFSLPAGKLMIDSPAYRAATNKAGVAYQTTVTLSAQHKQYNFNYDAEPRVYYFHRSFDSSYLYGDSTPAVKAVSSEVITDDKEVIGDSIVTSSTGTVYISTDLLISVVEEVLQNTYRQASFFFADDVTAADAAEAMRAAGYIAVPSDTEYTPDAISVILSLLLCLALAAFFVVAILFLAFFINLCTGRALAAFSGDMAIMRSMGISVRIIRIGMHVRMLLSLIPAYLAVAATAILIFTSPTFNGYFVYLYAWQYALIFLGVLLLTLRVTQKQVRRLFAESVKKSLRGGAAV